MLTTSGVYGCRDHSALGGPNPTSIGDLDVKFRQRFFPRATARLKTLLPGVIGSSYADPPCITRMKRLKNRRTNGTSRMDLSKRKQADYTELAYREAISKLKYLLAESYAPSRMSGTKPQSVRSIYNSRISESGEDTDDQSVISGNFRRRGLAGTAVSKTSPSFSKSLQSAKVYSNVALSRADLQSIPPELTSFIERQEDYIEQLERESQYCRDELMNLLSKVREVVAENEALHKKDQAVFSKCALQAHKDCVATDHECRERNAMDNRDANGNLEGKRERLLEGPRIIFESRISELEAQLTQARLELRKAQEENQANLKRLSEICPSAEGGVELRVELDRALRAKCEAEMKLEEAQKLLSAARDKETEATQRAKRSMDDRQQIEFERSQSEMEIRRLRDELERQHEKLREAAQETSRRITEERQQLERRYNQQVEQLSADIASHWETANKSQLESEKQRREINEFRRELSQKQTSMDNLKKELQNKISTLQSDLNQALSEKDAAEQEVLTGKLAAERSERQARQEQNRSQSEINSYKQRLERADADLMHCRRENLRLSEQIASLEKEISMSKIAHPEGSRSQATPRLENEKELTSMIMDMETKHEGVVERDVTTVGHTASPSSKKRTVKVDLKVKVIPKKKSDTSKTSLSAQEEMAGLQSNIEHLSNKIQGTFVSHEGGGMPMETNDGAAFRYDSTMDSAIAPSQHANGLSIGENDDVAASQTINRSYEGPTATWDSSAPRGNDRSQDLIYDQTRAVANHSSPNATMEMYDRRQRSGDDRNVEQEYIADDQHADTYMAEQQGYDQYSGYNPSQYQDEQYINGEQFNVVAEQMEDNRIVSDDLTVPDAEASH